MQRKDILIFYFILSISSLFAIQGTIHFSDGKCIQGQVSLDRELYFRDLFLESIVNIPIQEVYCLELLLDGNSSYQAWNKDTSQSLERRFVLAIHTWSGKSYWGKLNLHVSVKLPNGKKNRYMLPKTQVIWDRNNKNISYIRSIVFGTVVQDSVHAIVPEKLPQDFVDSSKDTTTKRIPSFLSLSGKLQPIGIFHTIYALNHHSGIMFQTSIEKDGTSYYIPRIMPGSYSIFLVGHNELIFGLATPQRKGFIDKTTDSEGDRLSLWVRKSSDTFIIRELIYSLGHHSQTYAIISEKKISSNVSPEGVPTVTETDYSLWSCYRRGESWVMRHNYFLHKQLTPKQFTFLYDERLEAIFIPNNGPQYWSYTPE